MCTINSKAFQLSFISTDRIIIMADNIEKCIYCQKTFTGLNNYNRDKHIESCKIKNGTPKNGNRNIKAFFKSSDSSYKTSLSTSNKTSPSTFNKTSPSNYNKTSPSTVSLSLDIISPHYNIQNFFSPLSQAGTVCDSLDSWNQILNLGCVTFGLLDLDSFYENFAFQQLDSLQNVILVNKSFHYKTCNGLANKQCDNLQFFQPLTVNIVFFVTWRLLGGYCNMLQYFYMLHVQH